MLPERILILGGTREARQLADVLVGEGFHPITSLAGVTETPVLPAGEVRTGGFGGVTGLKAYIENNGIGLVVDATHPFAAKMSTHADEACGLCGVPLLRLERPAWSAGAGDLWMRAGTIAEAACMLPAGARVLLTTGRKDLEAFFDRADLWGVARMIETPPIAVPGHWLILQERPPYTVAGEASLMAEFGITHLVTKNAGGSATEAKLEAARRARIEVIMIDRPRKPQVQSFAAIDRLMAVLKSLLSP